MKIKMCKHEWKYKIEGRGDHAAAWRTIANGVAAKTVDRHTRDCGIVVITEVETGRQWFGGEWEEEQGLTTTTDPIEKDLKQ